MVPVTSVGAVPPGAQCVPRPNALLEAYLVFVCTAVLAVLLKCLCCVHFKPYFDGGAAYNDLSWQCVLGEASTG